MQIAASGDSQFTLSRYVQGLPRLQNSKSPVTHARVSRPFLLTALLLVGVLVYVLLVLGILFPAALAHCLPPLSGCLFRTVSLVPLNICYLIPVCSRGNLCREIHTMGYFTPGN